MAAAAILKFENRMGYCRFQPQFQVTYESGGSKLQINYVLVRRSELSTVKDVKVIAGEECIQQHRLLVCVLNIKEQLRKCKKNQ